MKTIPWWNRSNYLFIYFFLEISAAPDPSSYPMPYIWESAIPGRLPARKNHTIYLAYSLSVPANK